MKIEKLEVPVPADPAALIVNQILDLPLQSVVLAVGDFYNIKSQVTATIIRTGHQGWVTDERFLQAAGINANKYYLSRHDVEILIRHLFDRGGEFYFIDHTTI